MLTTHANNARNNASTATNTLLATNTPGNTGGMLAAEQGRGDVSSRGGSRADIPESSLIGKMTAEAQSARDAFAYGTVMVDGKVYRMREDWPAVMGRAAAKYGSKA